MKRSKQLSLRESWHEEMMLRKMGFRKAALIEME
jgi:hypothetical protein